MKPNFITQSLRSIALTSLLIPVSALSVSQVNAATPVELSENAVLAETTNEAKAKLMAKLNKLAYFSADFTQKILSVSGEVLQEGAGNLAISKPNLVNWKTTLPDETLIVSDGETLWFYDPFIEQASAYSLSQSINNTPILLLTSDDPQLWQQYDVIEGSALKSTADKGALYFEVTPKDSTSQIKKLTLTFVDTSANSKNKTVLSEFSFQDATGQTSKITLSHFTSQTKPDSDLFTFTLPEGVRLEDKR